MIPRALAQAACALLGGLLLASCSNQVAAIDPAQSWLMYQRTPDHNTIVPRAHLSMNWSIDAGGQINGGMALNRDVLFADTLAGDLLAIDVRNKNVVWRAHVKHALMSTPVIYRGMVYVGSGSTQISSEFAKSWSVRKIVMGHPEGDAIYAYDAASGRLRWSYRTTGEDMPSPAIYRGMLIFANGDFHAYALDAASGRLVWKRELPGLATMSSAAIGGKSVFVSTCDYRFPYRCQTEALDPSSGRIRWIAPYGDADASPAYANGTVFVSGLDYARARRSWPLVQQGYAVVAALDAAGGKPKWVYRDGEPELPSDVGTSERAIAGTYAAGKYFQSIPGRGMLFAFDARTGAVLWRFHALGPIKMSALYYHNRVYAGGSAGVLYVLNGSNGKIMQVQTFRQPFTAAPPLVLGDTLLIPQNRFVRALPLQSLSGSADLAPVMKDEVQRWTR